MPDTTVKFYQSTDSGAPSLSGAAGSLLALLDACLVDGYGSVTLTSLEVASNVATGVVSGGHGFTAVGATGPVLRVAGATPSGLNGDWRVTVVNSTTFTFATTGISNQTASGTITAKRAPAGFSKAFTGTNKTAYRSDDTNGLRFYLRVLDTSATDTRLVGYESMSGIDTGTDPFPTATQMSGGLHFIKSYSSSTPPWRLFADSRAFYLFATIANADWDDYGSGYKTAHFAFGDFNSFKAADAYAGMIAGQLTTEVNVASGGLLEQNTTFGVSRISARDYNGSGKSTPNGSYLPRSNWPGDYIGASAQNVYPNQASGGMIIVPYALWDTTVSDAYWRGNYPGLYSPMHDRITDGTVETTASGRQLFLCRCCPVNNSWAQVAVDITGPWR